MKNLLISVAFLAATAAPVLAGGVMFTMPTLIWPQDATAPVTRGCVDLSTPVAVCTLPN